MQNKYLWKNDCIPDYQAFLILSDGLKNWKQSNPQPQEFGPQAYNAWTLTQSSSDTQMLACHIPRITGPPTTGVDKTG